MLRENRPAMNEQLSKFLSFVLRHRPQAIGITLDAEGWVAVDELLAAAARHGQSVTRQQVEEVVATNDKQRFSFSADGRRIRANQGHSVEVDLGLVPVEPPELLYHGTVERFLDSIRQEGLVRGKRHHVHLSADRETAAARGPAPRPARGAGGRGRATCTARGMSSIGRRTACG